MTAARGHMEEMDTDLAVIGTGLAGMAAALFAAKRGTRVTLVGRTGELIFASGLLDLLGCDPSAPEKPLENPWAGIERLVVAQPEHPYSRLTIDEIRTAFDEILAILQEADLPYCRDEQANAQVLTPLGTLHPTYCVPESLWNGVTARRQGRSCLLVDFKGLKGYSAGLIAESRAPTWPGLRWVRIAFPGSEHLHEVQPEHMANALILEETREALADLIKPHLGDAKVVGLPAVLGIYRTERVISDLSQRLGVPLFELPTMPPSMPGLRLKEALENGLRQNQRACFLRQHVKTVDRTPGGRFRLAIETGPKPATILAQGIILATGRYSGGGLHADRETIREALLGLPVVQPSSREQWHRERLFDPRGHAVNRAGLAVDAQFRPVDPDGRPVYQTLFAAGSILAHQDWKRTKCGAGLAIATAWGAVKQAVDRLNL